VPPWAFPPPLHRLHHDTRAFFRVQGDEYVPGPHARGRWADTVSGPVVGGLLGRTIERDTANPEFQPARLTVDMPRPTLLEPVAVETSVIREGRRIKLVDAVIVQRGQVTAHARAVLVRRGQQPEGQVRSTSVAMPEVPKAPDSVPADLQMVLLGYGADRNAGMPWLEWDREHAQKFIWVRQIRPLVEGETMSPFTSAAMAGDLTSAVAHWGTSGLRFLNVDYTVSLSRLPEGPEIGLASIGHYSETGVASGMATLFDHRGPIGSGVAIALGSSAAKFRTTNLAVTRC
jgi:hypothetical protein